jgi:hypothetical protein
VEENEQQFFAFQSLKDFDLYFQSLAYSNCLDGNVKTNKAEHDIEEQKSNLATNGILERKVIMFSDYCYICRKEKDRDSDCHFWHISKGIHVEAS